MVTEIIKAAVTGEVLQKRTHTNAHIRKIQDYITKFI